MSSEKIFECNVEIFMEAEHHGRRFRARITLPDGKSVVGFSDQIDLMYGEDAEDVYKSALQRVLDYLWRTIAEAVASEQSKEE